MQNRTRPKSAGELSRVYRFTRRLSRSRERFLMMVSNEMQRGSSLSQQHHKRIENLRSRMTQLTLRRHDEIMRVYSNVSLSRYRPPSPKRPKSSYRSRPRTPKPRRAPSATPRDRAETPPRPMAPTPPRSSRSSTLSAEPVPPPRTPSPNLPVEVVKIVINDGQAFIDMQPAPPKLDKKFEESDEEDENDGIIYPEGITDVRPYQTVARYRRAKGKSTNFREEPLLVGMNEAETLVLGLDAFAEEHGCVLTFINESHQLDNSIYRAACGVVDLGSIHILAADSLLTANFEFEIKLDFDHDIAPSKENVEQFVMDFCGAMSEVLSCDRNDVRVFSIHRLGRKSSKSEVRFGLTSPEYKRTEQLAEALQTYARTGFTENKTLERIIPRKYDYKWKPALKFLKLKSDDLAPEFNADYRLSFYPEKEERGGHPYYLPLGWYRHGLRVLQKYEKDPAWIGQVNGKNEWAVAYHGTRAEAVPGILKHGLLTSAVQRDAMLEEAIEKMGEEANQPGVYVATNCDGGAQLYTVAFPVTSFPGKTEFFELVFQCRVKPEKFTEHEDPVNIGTAWRYVDPSYIRPYGILLKKVEPPSDED